MLAKENGRQQCRPLPKPLARRRPRWLARLRQVRGLITFLARALVQFALNYRQLCLGTDSFVCLPVKMRLCCAQDRCAKHPRRCPSCGGQAMLKSLALERIYRDSRCGSLMLPWTAEICMDRIGREREG